MSTILMAVIGVVYASQLVLAGRASSWAAALGAEAAFWFSWAVVSWLIFRLCRILHRGPPDWRRYAIIFAGGAAVVVLAFPALFQAVLIGAHWLARALSFTADVPASYWPEVRRTTLNLLGLTVVLYVATVLGWHAVTHYRDLKEREIKAAEWDPLESTCRHASLSIL